MGARIYNLFPLLAGPIPAWRDHLDRIGRMGFDWIYLNPIQAPGFSGSLYAIKDPYSYHPALIEGVREDPERALRGFLEEAGRRGISVMCDLVMNHTSKDALLTGTHPEWFLREADGKLRSPSAIDPADARKVTVWGDLAELDYERPEPRAGLLRYWTDFALHQCALGFRGFRCDAAYKVPAEVWSALIGEVRERHPEVIFCAETLGCRLEETAAVAACGFDYLFNSSKWWDFHASWCLEQYEAQRHIAPSISFPESHDTPRLAEEVGGGFELLGQRYAFAAAFSAAVMMPIGYEYGARRKLDVVRTRRKDREPPACDLTEIIERFNAVKASAPVLGEEGPIRRLGEPQDPVARLFKSSERGGGAALLWINTVAEEREAPAGDVNVLGPEVGWSGEAAGDARSRGEALLVCSSSEDAGASGTGRAWARPLKPFEVRLLLEPVDARPGP